MQSSLFNKFTTTLAIKKQVNLYVVNTFFALSAASYYVGTYSLPKDFHWAKYITKLYTLQEDTQLINQETGFPANLYAFAHYHPTMRVGDIKALRISTGSFQPLQKTSKQILDETSIVPNTSLSDTPFSMGALLNKDFMAHSFGVIKMPSLRGADGDVAIQLKHLPLGENFSLEQMTGQTNSFVGSALPRLSPQPPSPHSLPMIAENSIVQNFQTQSMGVIQDVNLEHTLRIVRAPLGATHPDELNISPPSVEPVKPLVENPRINEAPVVSPLPQESLLSWSSYMLHVRNDKNPLLRFWMMKVAPGRNVKPEELRFRGALKDTLLEFQDYINESLEDDDYAPIKKIRRRIHNSYMKRALDPVMMQSLFGENYMQRTFKAEDFEKVDSEAYIEAYDFPSKIGLGKIYRDDDICY